SHDLGVVKHMCDYIYIMYRGRIVERGTREDIYNNPQHIYTKRLIAAIPSTDLDKAKEIKRIREEVEKEYQDKYNDYFDEDGKVYSLKKLSDSHYVAMKGG
ncbi:ABC transporter ATP-binding protein, partial [Streptococcus danieliae]|nr:ABC transporter ATP-binding protein [Streptococcus danieliae]